MCLLMSPCEWRSCACDTQFVFVPTCVFVFVYYFTEMQIRG
uniref:Uncharacterized protein n=1 Tax=Arundo donax TaxID=35708 RepID=A0A0A8YS83_ARUDO